MIVTDIYTLQTPDWQMGLSDIGDIATDLSDVTQCVRVIVLTNKGEDPLRPLFGCGLYNYIDMPVSQSAPLIIREVSEAVALWEKRVKLNAVRVTVADDGAGLNIELDLTYLNPGLRRTIIIPTGTPQNLAAFTNGFDNGFY